MCNSVDSLFSRLVTQEDYWLVLMYFRQVSGKDWSSG